MSGQVKVLKCWPRVEPDMQAVLLTADNLDEVAAWCGGKVIGRDINWPEIDLVANEPDNYGMTETAEPGQYVVRGCTGHYWPMEAWMFERDYQASEAR